MSVLIETERLVLRELVAKDAQSLFAMDSDPEVHRYLGNNPLVSLLQSQEQIKFIQQQYHDNGIGRWAVLDKHTGEFVGWAGLKFITEPLHQKTNYYDLGYRFLRQYWGRGYATETARASLCYGFYTLQLACIYAIAHLQNQASNQVLTKLGFACVEKFDLNGEQHNWYEIQRPEKALSCLA